MIQITVIKITGYGPWTLTLGSDREHKIQMLQASLYLQIQKLFSEKNGLVFSNRSDEFFAITSGITLEDHIEIQKKLESSFDLKLSMSIGYGDSPFEANLSAYDGKKSEINYSLVLAHPELGRHEFVIPANGLADGAVYVYSGSLNNPGSVRLRRMP